MRNPQTDNTWLWVLGGVAAVAWYLNSQQQATTTPTPYSIYPSLAWTAQTSMASSPTQQASTAGPPPPPTPLFQSVQQQEQAALYTQCAGSNVCSIVTADTQLGL